MAAIMTPARRKRAKIRVINYRVSDNGRMYRVCATDRGRVLMVMLKHKNVEQALDIYGRRFKQIAQKAALEHAVELRVAQNSS
jgi:hypothetical protein